MWLTRVLDGAGTGKSYIFECKACGAQVTLSAPPDGASGLEDDL
jgi:hypothetical protein